MRSRKNIGPTVNLHAKFSAAALLALFLAGCQSPATHSAAGPGAQANAKSHRPPTAFTSDGFETESAAKAPVVNVFGEVNGAAGKAVPLSSESAFQQHTFTDEGFDSDVAVDPTGKWLAFSSTRNSEHPGIYLQRVDGTAVTQLTDGNSDDAYPTFSPDGRQIAFSSTRAGNWQVFLMDVDGHNVTQITSGTSQAIHPSFSPDGSRLVYCGLSSRTSQWELWTVDLKTAEKRMIGYGLFPSWSADRTADRIAFQRARQRGSRWFSLWTLDLVNGEGRRVTEVAVSANAAILSPAWSPDGKRIAFTTVVQPGKGGAGKPAGQTDVWTIDADGTHRQRLSDGRGTNLMPFWAMNNRVYFVSDRGGSECIWSVRAEPARVESTAQGVAADAKPNSAAPSDAAASVGAADTHEIAH